ncbi:MAG: tetratricopeptide repeat protein [Capsulimonadaceae bacterium]|nr:tetratricopeptide repeat protein [Capsulimonadaceae bacterium]
MPTASQTIAFLFTDIEGSTWLWKVAADYMRSALPRHDAVLEDCIAAAGGRTFKKVGDALYASFPSVDQAIVAAITGQIALSKQSWGDHEIRVRMAVHIGAVDVGDDDYHGHTLSRVARVLSIAHGGQVLLSDAARSLALDDLPEECSLQDLGFVHLRGIDRPERVYQLVHPDLKAVFPRPQDLDSTPTNIKRLLTSFFGRSVELESVRKSLERTPLVSLIGAAGCGKSRLAREYALRTLAAYGDGAWSINLGGAPANANIADLVASAMGLRNASMLGSAAVATHLRSHHCLLIFDNFDSVRSGLNEFAEELLNDCPHLRIIATGREPLGIPGEQLLPIGPLQVPDASADAAQLVARLPEAMEMFVDRASAVSPSFHITEGNAGAIASICRDLGGIPLALELTAPRIRILPPKELADRVRSSYGLHAQRSGGQSPQSGVLTSALKWSVESLPDRVRDLLAKLLVFSGGWMLDAAEAIYADANVRDDEIADHLGYLVDKSLVLVTDREDLRWFRLLDLLRGFVDLPDEAAQNELRQRHAEFYLGLAKQFATEIQSNPPRALMERLDREQPNFRAAIEFQIQSGRIEDCLNMVNALWQFWAIRGHLRDGLNLIIRVLASAPEPNSLRAAALMSAGVIASELGDMQAARAFLLESVDILRGEEGSPSCAVAQANLALICQHEQAYDEARQLYSECLAVFTSMGHQLGIAMILGNLGMLAYSQGKFDEADENLRQSLTLSREVGSTRACAVAMGNLGNLQMGRNDSLTALGWFSSSLDLFYELGDKRGVASALDAVVRATEAGGGDPRVAMLLGGADHLRDETKFGLSAREETDARALRSGVQARLGEHYKDTYLAGWQMPLAEIIRIARSLCPKSPVTA